MAAASSGSNSIYAYQTTYVIKKAGQLEGATKVQRGHTLTVDATGVVKETGKKFWCVRANVLLLHCIAQIYFLGVLPQVDQGSRPAAIYLSLRRA